MAAKRTTTLGEQMFLTSGDQCNVSFVRRVLLPSKVCFPSKALMNNYGRVRTFHTCKARLPSSPLLSCPRPSAAATLWAAFLSPADSPLGNTSSLSSLFANSRTRAAIWNASSEISQKCLSFDYNHANLLSSYGYLCAPNLRRWA